MGGPCKSLLDPLARLLVLENIETYPEELGEQKDGDPRYRVEEIECDAAGEAGESADGIHHDGIHSDRLRRRDL
jgi:hypothetical protein